VTRRNIPNRRRPSTAPLRKPNNSYFQILIYSSPVYSFNYFPKQHNPTKDSRSMQHCGLQRQPQRLLSGRRKPVITTGDRLCCYIRFHEMSCAMQRPASCLYIRVALSNVVIVTIMLLKLVYEELLMEHIQA
jgi:hypothetical protein